MTQLLGGVVANLFCCPGGFARNFSINQWLNTRPHFQKCFQFADVFVLWQAGKQYPRLKWPICGQFSQFDSIDDNVSQVADPESLSDLPEFH